jgi:hypothetical protein
MTSQTRQKMRVSILVSSNSQPSRITLYKLELDGALERRRDARAFNRQLLRAAQIIYKIGEYRRTQRSILKLISKLSKAYQFELPPWSVQV